MKNALQQIVLFILILGLAVVGYQFMIRPVNRNLAEQKERVKAKVSKLAEFEDATKVAEGLNKQLEQLQEAINFFESKLPPTSQIHKVLEQVTVIAQKQGLKPKTIKTLATKDNSGYVEQPMKMELEGDFTSFYAFLLELEKLPRIIKIRELKLAKETTDEGQVDADFIVSIFFQNKT